jgi:hypothetical protein
MLVNCGAYQIEEGNRLIDWRYTPATFKITPHFLPAPEQWQVVEWLRVNHGIWVYSYNNGTSWIGSIQKTNGSIIRIIPANNLPQEAYSACIDYVLKHLI